jgi:Vps51/Vps67
LPCRLPEKGIALLRSDLAALEAECGQELRRSVYDNYKPFIEASQVGSHESKRVGQAPQHVHR